MKKPGAKTIIRDLLEIIADAERRIDHLKPEKAETAFSKEQDDALRGAREFLARKPAKRMAAKRPPEKAIVLRGTKPEAAVLRYQAKPGQLVEFIDADGETLFEAFLSEREADSLTVRAKANDVWRAPETERGGQTLLLPELLLNASGPGQFHFKRREFRS